jgi:hypothetical protein
VAQSIALISPVLLIQQVRCRRVSTVLSYAKEQGLGICQSSSRVYQVTAVLQAAFLEGKKKQKQKRNPFSTPRTRVLKKMQIYLILKLSFSSMSLSLE